jgi:hypothetical protein
VAHQLGAGARLCKFALMAGYNAGLSSPATDQE